MSESQYLKRLRAIEELIAAEKPVNEADQLLSTILDDYVRRRDATRELACHLRGLRLNEQIRRHQEGLTFKSTYNRDRIKTLEAMLARLRSELKPLVLEVEAKMIEIDFAEQELKAYKDADEAVRMDRELKVKTGLYADTLWMVEKLFREFDVHRGHYALLTDDDIEAIATIMIKRQDTALEEQSWEQTYKDARAF